MNEKSETTRSPYDGRPYYCAECGAALGEFVACEDGGCRLERAVTARRRAADKRDRDSILAEVLKEAGNV